MGGQESWRSRLKGGLQYNLPTALDGGIRTFHAWLREYADGRFPGSEPRECGGERFSPALFDKWEMHTKRCGICRAALARWVAIAVWARRIAAAAVACGAVGGVLARGLGPVVWGVVVALGGILLADWAEGIAHSFTSMRPRRGAPVI